MNTPDRRDVLFQRVEGIVIPFTFNKDVFRESLSYKAKPGDIFIATYPKSGTTWTQMIVYLIQNKGEPPPNSQEIGVKVPFLENGGLQYLDNGQKVFGIKTHFPYNRIPYSKHAKYIYVARNPKDVVVSYYYHRSNVFKELYGKGAFDTLFDMFMDGLTESGNYFDHVLGWYEHRHDANVLFLTYEDMKMDTKGNILKIAKFMDIKYREMLENEPAILENVLKFSSMQEMKNMTKRGMDLSSIESASPSNPRQWFPKPHLVREGAVGKWRNVLSPEQSEKIDKELRVKLFDTELFDMWKNI